MAYYKRVKVTFNLPFLVDITNGLYKIKTDNFLCGLNIRLKQANDNPSEWQGNARFTDDRFGHTNYSEILVEFVFNEKIPYIPGKDEFKFENYSLEAVNRLLDGIRWITDDYVNHHIIRKDIPSMHCDFFNESDASLGGNYFSMRSEMRVGGNSRTQEEVDSLKNKLENNQKIPFEIELIRNAKDHLKFKNYRMVSIEIQNAIEYVIAEITSKYLTSEGKSESEINDILNDGFKRFKDYFKEATSESITQSNEYTQWQNKCAKLRHLVLHRGKQPSPQEAKEALQTGIDFLKILENFR